jgi:hypothetical protein
MCTVRPWCCVQVARLLHALDRLASRKMFRLFRTAPPPTAVYDSSEGRHAYNRVIPLPLGLEDIQVSACLQKYMCHIYSSRVVQSECCSYGAT